MKIFRHAFCVLLVATCAVRAQQDEESSIPDYTPTVDDNMVLYVPKYTVRLAFRGLSGSKVAFGGHSFISSPQSLGDTTSVANRLYQDGYVNLDSRTVTDPAGNSVPISPDGRTNNWKFIDTTQATDYPGLIAMHAYTAETTDASFHEKNPGIAVGVEVESQRDMGKLWGSKVKWGLIAGMSVNQIYSTTHSALSASISRTTDLYSLGGQLAPDVSTTPYIAPETNGGVDISTLLGDTVLQRSVDTSSSTTAVLSTWKLRGAYLTMRAGPTVTVPIGGRFSATFSAGGVLVYAGTSYEITQTFQPQTGDVISEDSLNTRNALMPGFYADADVEYAMTDTAGLYVGGVYQNSGSYTQKVTSADGLSTYLAKVDLSSLQGIRAGVSFRF